MKISKIGKDDEKILYNPSLNVFILNTASETRYFQK